MGGNETGKAPHSAHTHETVAKRARRGARLFAPRRGRGPACGSMRRGRARRLCLARAGGAAQRAATATATACAGSACAACTAARRRCSADRCAATAVACAAGRAVRRRQLSAAPGQSDDRADRRAGRPRAACRRRGAGPVPSLRRRLTAIERVPSNHRPGRVCDVARTIACNAAPVQRRFHVYGRCAAACQFRRHPSLFRRVSRTGGSVDARQRTGTRQPWQGASHRRPKASP